MELAMDCDTLDGKNPEKKTPGIFKRKSNGILVQNF